METLMLSVIVFTLAFVGLGIGILFSDKKTIKGSCGGTGSNGSCNTCGTNRSACKNKEHKSDTRSHYGNLHNLIQKNQHRF